MKNTILVIDDNAMPVDIYEGVFSLWKFKVAFSGEEGLKILDQISSEISLIILDYRMPGLNGLEVLSQIRLTHLHIPVIMHTSDTHIEHEAFQLGAHAFLPKLTDPKEFEKVIRRLLNK